VRVTLDVGGQVARIVGTEEAPPGSRFVPVSGGPAGLHLAVSDGRCAVRDFDGRVLSAFDAGFDVRMASASADRSTLVVGDVKGVAEIVDATTGASRALGAITAAAFAPDGRILAGTEDGPGVLDRDGKTIVRHRIPAEPEDEVTEVSVAPEGRFAAFRTTW